MKKPKASTNDVLINDLGNHATAKVAQALSDAVGLLDTQDDAYSLVASVLGGVICWTAKLRPGKQSHEAKIALVLRDLTEIMVMHKEHGE